MNGVKRAAAIILLLGEERSAAIWEHFDEDEITALSIAMAELGDLAGTSTQEIMARFCDDLYSYNNLRGTFERTELFLRSVLPREKAEAIIDEMRGRTSQGVWRKLAGMDANVLSAFLMNEHPQTVAFVMTRLEPKLAAKVLSSFTTEHATGVMERMLTISSVPKTAIDDLEKALSEEFIMGSARTAQRNQFEIAADLFNEMDRSAEERIMESLLNSNESAAVRVRKLMFTFDDVSSLSDQAIQTILQGTDKMVLAKALRGTREVIRQRFLKNLSTRARAVLLDNIESLAPMRVHEIEQAQAVIVDTAKLLGERGEISIGKGEELI